MEPNRLYLQSLALEMFAVARNQIVRPERDLFEHEKCSRYVNYGGVAMMITLTLDEFVRKGAYRHAYHLCLCRADQGQISIRTVDHFVHTFFGSWKHVHELPPGLLPIGWRHMRQFCLPVYNFATAGSTAA